MPGEYITRDKGLDRFKLHLVYISIMNTRDITLSEKEQRRQAVDSLKGYIYQIYQSKEIHCQYLTTSEIGKEKGILFPNEQPGLLFWRTAAREGSDLEPLRKALQFLDQFRYFVNC